jgi:hypothetical protein
LIAYLSGEAIVDFCVRGTGAFAPVAGFDKIECRPPSPEEIASVPAKVVQQFVPITAERFLHRRRAAPVRSDRRRLCTLADGTGSLFQQGLREIFEDAGKHEACIRQIEAWHNRTGKVGRLRYYHFARSMWEVEGNVVPEHCSIVIRGLPLSGAD